MVIYRFVKNTGLIKDGGANYSDKHAVGRENPPRPKEVGFVPPGDKYVL